MTKPQKQSSAKINSPANVVDGKLILTLTSAVTPVVWQMDMEHVKSAAMEVREDKAQAIFSLVMKNEQNEVTEIAQFKEREDAVNALMATSVALQEAQGRLRPQASMPQPQFQSAPLTMPAQMPPTQNSSKAGGVLAVILIFVLLLVWMFSIPRGGVDFKQSADMASTAGSGGATDTGVPVSADEFLSNQN